MQEFKVNKYLNLKLENNETIIYVSGKKYRQCKYLLLEIPIDNINSFNEIDSIDEAVEALDQSLEPFEEDRLNSGKEYIKLPPEVEFWGHCSNLQAWANFNYDTRLLHSNLAFPLLKELMNAGDTNAKKKFKAEIAKRLLAGNFSTIEFLYEEGYVNYLTREEFWSIFDEDGEILFDIEKKIEQFKEITDVDLEGQKIKRLVKKKRQERFYFHLGHDIVIDNGPMVFTFEMGKVTGIGIWGDFRDFPLSLRKNSILKLKESPESISRLEQLKILVLNEIGLEKFPQSITSLKLLEFLSLSHNNLKSIPQFIDKLENLKYLELYNISGS